MHSSLKIRLRRWTLLLLIGYAFTFVTAEVYGREPDHVVWGKSGAEAVAILVPRDIILVVDTSRSMLFDSHLVFEELGKTINMAEVYEDLCNLPPPSTPMPPTLGDPNSPMGPMVWTPDALSMPQLECYRRNGVAWIEEPIWQEPGRNNWVRKPEEYWGDADTSPFVIREMMVLMGLAKWADPENRDLNDNEKIDPEELVDITPWYFPSTLGEEPYTGTQARLHWEDYLEWATNHIGNHYHDQHPVYYREDGMLYMADEEHSTKLGRIGIRTLIAYLFDRRYSFEKTPQLCFTREQPITAVKNAACSFIDYLETAGSKDHVGVIHYDITSGVKLTDPYDPWSAPDEDYPNYQVATLPRISADYNPQGVKESIRMLQAGHHFSWTNIGNGIRAAKNHLLQARRGTVMPVIVLLTDGNATHSPSDNYWREELPPPSRETPFDYEPFDPYPPNDQRLNFSSGKEYMREMAYQTGQAGIRIYTITVGSDADLSVDGLEDRWQINPNF
jgi:hypothetical protein